MSACSVPRLLCQNMVKRRYAADKASLPVALQGGVQPHEYSHLDPLA